MAESVVHFAVEKLAAFLIAESELLGSLVGDVRALENELATIKEVLKDAEKRAEHDDSINEWLRQVRDIGYHIEDVIDDYFLLKECRQQQWQERLFITRIRKWLGKAVACVSELKPKHELISKIKEIKVELLEISSRRERYHFITATDNSNQHYKNLQCSQVCSLFMDDSELFGIRDHKADIFRRLNLEEDDHLGVECFRSVIAVVGMGGVGKTTLVRKVYEDKVVRNCFPVVAWVTVSPSYQWSELLKSIYKQVDAQPSLQADASDEITIINDLRNHLKDRRYLVVFDDVWDEELWRSVKAALPSNSTSSRILMTARHNNIALHCMASLGSGHVYDLKPLPEEAAWDLFCHKAFTNGNCPPELKEFLQDMVKRCEGLPLAIVAIAGLFSIRDQVPSEWNKVYNSLSFELRSNRHLTSLTNILLLSYHELPYYLKPCFLYFGMLPEAFLLSRMRLIRLWIAEGFIQYQRGKTLEEVAGEYLGELVNRNLVQGYAKGFSTERRLFRVHEMLRKIIILPKLDSLGFCQILPQDSSPTIKHCRRLSIHADYLHDSNRNNVLQMVTGNPAVRSLLCFVHPATIPALMVSSLLEVSRFFKVLDFENAPIDQIPEELGNFQHLRYLSLRNTKVKVLPKSIGELQNLQTLNLKQCCVVELPRDIGHCHKLRHLLTSRVNGKSRQGVTMHDGVLENFKELQKLAYMEANRARLLDELKHVHQLRRLAITNLKKEHGRALCHAIEEMKHLRSLFIKSVNPDELIDIQQVSKSPPLLLEYIFLEGRLEKLPDWITKLKNLAKLKLVSSRLEDDPVKALQVLPNLLSLTLSDAYVGEQLDFGITQFSKLEKLELRDLCALKSLIGVSLPVLQDALVIHCPLLLQLPPPIYKLVPPNNKSFG